MKIQNPYISKKQIYSDEVKNDSKSNKFNREKPYSKPSKLNYYS